MFEAFSSSGKRKLTLILLVLCFLSAVAAAIVGISDNPPGIVLAYLSAFVFILAFVHPWKSAKPYLYLVLAAVLGLVATVVLHNLCEAGAGSFSGSPFLQDVLGGLGVLFFMIAILLCPAAFLVGIFGAIVTLIKKKNHPASPPEHV